MNLSEKSTQGGSLSLSESVPDLGTRTRTTGAGREAAWSSGAAWFRESHEFTDTRRKCKKCSEFLSRV